MIKASDDMFVIYGCDVPPRWIVRRLNCDSNHEFLEVFERGKDYEVCFEFRKKTDKKHSNIVHIFLDLF